MLWIDSGNPNNKSLSLKPKQVCDNEIKYIRRYHSLSEKCVYKLKLSNLLKKETCASFSDNKQSIKDKKYWYNESNFSKNLDVGFRRKTPYTHFWYDDSVIAIC